MAHQIENTKTSGADLLKSVQGDVVQEMDQRDSWVSCNLFKALEVSIPRSLDFVVVHKGISNARLTFFLPIQPKPIKTNSQNEAEQFK